MANKNFNQFSVRVDDGTLDKIEEVQNFLGSISRNVAVTFILNQGLMALSEKGIISPFDAKRKPPTQQPE